jgi:hypothetical protein
VLLGEHQFALHRRVNGGQGLGKQPLGQGANVGVTQDAIVERHGTGGVNQAPGKTLGERDDSPQTALTNTSLVGEQALAELLGGRPDRLGLPED